MAIIGFLALMLFGLYLVFAACASLYVHAALSGSTSRRLTVAMLVIFSVGVFCIYQAFTNAPFTVAMEATNGNG